MTSNTARFPTATAAASLRRPRVAAIDALRGLAVVLMVQQHLGVWLVSGQTLAQPWVPVLLAVNMAGGAAAPLFVFLSGVGVALAWRGSGSAGWSATMALRGALLLVFGLALNLLTPSWFSPGSFYVLHLLGCWLMLAPLFAPRSLRGLWGAFAVIVIGAGLLQLALDTPPALNSQQLADATAPGGVFRLALVEGHFPLFPWLALAILGLIAGRWWREGRPWPIFMMSLVLAGIGLALRLVTVVEPRMGMLSPYRHFVGFSFYPATSAFVCLLGALCAGLCAGAYVLERRGVFSAGRGWAALGRTSLTLLFVHIVVFRELATVWQMRNRVDGPWLLATIVGLLVGWTLLSRAWLRVGLVGSLEWCLRELPRVVTRGTQTKKNQERPR